MQQFKNICPHNVTFEDINGNIRCLGCNAVIEERVDTNSKVCVSCGKQLNPNHKDYKED